MKKCAVPNNISTKSLHQKQCTVVEAATTVNRVQQSTQQTLKSTTLEATTMGKAITINCEHESHQSTLQTLDELEKELSPSNSKDSKSASIQIPSLRQFAEKCIQVNTFSDFLNQFSVMELFKSESQLNAWTGIPTFRLLHAIEDCVIVGNPNIEHGYSLSVLERIVLCFIKLKTNLSFACMTSLFQIANSTIAMTFNTMIPLIRRVLEVAIYFPSIEETRANLPKSFRKYKYETTRAIIDCSEVKIQIPQCINCRIASYSQYKKDYTLKFMLCITPGGMISNVSEAYSGKSSDKFIFNNENLIEKFDSFEDAIMMDKGVMIENELLNRGLQMVRPSFFRSEKEQFEELEVISNTKIAVLRVHVERAIQRMKIFRVLTHRMEYNIAPQINNILIITAAIANLTKPILAEDKF